MGITGQMWYDYELSVWYGSRSRGRGGRPGFFGDTSVVDSVRIAVNLALKKFRLDEVSGPAQLSTQKNLGGGSCQFSEQQC